MYKAIAHLPTSELVFVEVPAFGVSVLIAEAAYKFHSFTLELVAFLTTWYIVGFAARQIARLVGFRQS
jgi:hypothetical protein